MFQIHAFASGRVQGVNFRHYVQRKANELRVAGYVCNLDDGQVEILAQGSHDDLESLITYVRSNPGVSFVTNLDVSWEKPKGNLKGFRVTY